MSTPRHYGQAKDYRLGVRVTLDLKSELEKYAALEGIKVSQAVQDALIDWIAKQKWKRQGNDRPE